MTSRRHVKKRKVSSPVDPAGLLAAVADAFNACEQAGIPIRLKHGAVYTGHGYVLPAAGDLWVPRTLTWTEFPPDNGDNDD